MFVLNLGHSEQKKIKGKENYSDTFGYLKKGIVYTEPNNKYATL